jgi:hypothetical protein
MEAQASNPPMNFMVAPKTMLAKLTAPVLRAKPGMPMTFLNNPIPYTWRAIRKSLTFKRPKAILQPGTNK